MLIYEIHFSFFSLFIKSTLTKILTKTCPSLTSSSLDIINSSISYCQNIAQKIYVLLITCTVLNSNSFWGGLTFMLYTQQSLYYPHIMQCVSMCNWGLPYGIYFSLCSTFGLSFFSWLLTHVIYLKLRKKILFLQAEQVRWWQLFSQNFNPGPFWVTIVNLLRLQPQCSQQ